MYMPNRIIVVRCCLKVSLPTFAKMTYVTIRRRPYTMRSMQVNFIYFCFMDQNTKYRRCHVYRSTNQTPLSVCHDSK